MEGERKAAVGKEKVFNDAAFLNCRKMFRGKTAKGIYVKVLRYNINNKGS